MECVVFPATATVYVDSLIINKFHTAVHGFEAKAADSLRFDAAGTSNFLK